MKRLSKKQMIIFSLGQLDKEIIPHMCDRIDDLKKSGLYNGAYECVKLAVKGYE